MHIIHTNSKVVPGVLQLNRNLQPNFKKNKKLIQLTKHICPFCMCLLWLEITVFGWHLRNSNNNRPRESTHTLPSVCLPRKPRQSGYSAFVLAERLRFLPFHNPQIDIFHLQTKAFTSFIYENPLGYIIISLLYTYVLYNCWCAGYRLAYTKEMYPHTTRCPCHREGRSLDYTWSRQFEYVRYIICKQTNPCKQCECRPFYRAQSTDTHTFEKSTINILPIQ